MAHSTRVSVLHADGEQAFTTKLAASRLVAGGHAVEISDRQIIMAGTGIYEWRGKQSGRAGPRVMQRVPLNHRRRPT